MEFVTLWECVILWECVTLCATVTDTDHCFLVIDLHGSLWMVYLCHDEAGEEVKCVMEFIQFVSFLKSICQW